MAQFIKCEVATYSRAGHNPIIDWDKVEGFVKSEVIPQTEEAYYLIVFTTRTNTYSWGYNNEKTRDAAFDRAMSGVTQP